jgi:large subunit ribosomal protein L13
MNVVESAMSTRTVIDADGLILGRMASVIAKRLLAGETIELVNAQNVVISGNKHKLVEDWKEFLIVGGFGKGPVHHRRPHEIVRRTVRGMLPYRIKKGEEAYKRLHVHIGVPDEFEKAEMEKMPEYHSSKLNHRGVTVGELAESIGWNKMGVE